MNNKLIIVGNGFDLHHNMKTGYLNYREYLLNNGFSDIVKIYESNEEDFYEDDITNLWNDIETSIGLLGFEKAYVYLKNYGDDDWVDSYHHYFQYEIEKMAKYWPGIKEQLAGWIKSIIYTEPDEKLKPIITNESIYLSFNYTNTLERLYGVPKERICYIHGDVGISDELVLGHRNESYYPEWDDNNTDEDIRKLNAGIFMERFRKDTIKNIEYISAKNMHFQKILNTDFIEEIYVLGLSYNDTDIAYLKQISNKIKAKWYFSYYSKNDFNAIPSYAEEIRVNEYQRLTYQDI